MSEDLQIFKLKVDKQTFYLQELNGDDGIEVFRKVMDVIGMPIFRIVVEAIQHYNDLNEEESKSLLDLSLLGINPEDLPEEDLKGITLVNKYSKFVSVALKIFNSENEEAISKLLNKFNSEELKFVGKKILKDLTYSVEGDPKETKIDVDYDKYFTATKLPLLFKLIKFGMESNFGNFLKELFPDNEQDSKEKAQ